eukprot:351327-Chlamydomonas_euryale.AAC.4
MHMLCAVPPRRDSDERRDVPPEAQQPQRPLAARVTGRRRRARCRAVAGAVPAGARHATPAHVRGRLPRRAGAAAGGTGRGQGLPGAGREAGGGGAAADRRDAAASLAVPRTA